MLVPTVKYVKPPEFQCVCVICITMAYRVLALIVSQQRIRQRTQEV